VGAVNQGSAEWLEQRKGKITGTAVGVLEQVNPYQKPHEWVRAVVRDLAGAESEFRTNPAVEHGQAMESVAKSWYEKAFDCVVDETDFITHPKYSFLGASPDGLVGLDGALEIKCPYPKWNKAPYSVYDTKKKMYLRQCQLQMEVLDVDWIDFLCYLSPNADSHPEYNIERLHRESGWLHEEISASLLPVPVKGKIPRIDLYAEWHEHVHAEYNDLERRKVHTDAAQDMYEVVSDSKMGQLSDALTKKAEIESSISSQLKQIATYEDLVGALKKEIAETYDRNVTDGVSRVQVIKRRGSFNYREAFEVLGGDAALLAKGLDVEEFRSASNTRQIKVKLGD
jgi:putative phage-type endonuclease